MSEETKPKHPGGRPSKYTPELLEKAGHYRDNWRGLGRMIPSNAGLAVYLEVSRDTLYDWAKEEGKEEFSDILNAIQAKQEEVLMDKGLAGDFNSAITKLALGKHGYHDKIDNEHAGPGGAPMAVSWNVHPVKAIEPKGEGE